MLTAEQFDAICLESVICAGGDAYIINRINDLQNGFQYGPRRV